MKRAGEYLAGCLLRALFALFRALGPVRASNVGGALARTIGPLLPVTRVAERNLRLALPSLDEVARRRVIRAMFDNLGRVLAELPHLGDLRETAAGPGYAMVGAEHIDALAGGARPAVFVSAHFGNWEMLPVAAIQRGVPIGSLYRAANNAHVDRLINDLRGQAVGREALMFPKGAGGARRLLAHLARGGRVGILADQKMNDGIAVKLFGHDAMTPPAPATLALRFGCPVIPCHVRRIGPARFCVTCEPPLALPDSGDRQADIAALTRAINARYEAWITETPELWFWLHRRWPRSFSRD